MAQQSNFQNELCEINRQQSELIKQQQETIKFQQSMIIQLQEAASTQKSTPKQDNFSHFQAVRIERQLLAQKKSLDVLRQTLSQHQKWFLECKEREDDTFITEILEGTQSQVSTNDMNTSMSDSQIPTNTI